jgi:hypothetical protein
MGKQVDSQLWNDNLSILDCFSNNGVWKKAKSIVGRNQANCQTVYARGASMRGNLHDFDSGGKCGKQRHYLSAARVCEIMNGRTIHFAGDSTTNQVVSTFMGAMYYDMGMSPCYTCGYMCYGKYNIDCEGYGHKVNNLNRGKHGYLPVNWLNFSIFETRNDYLAIEYIDSKVKNMLCHFFLLN